MKDETRSENMLFRVTKAEKELIVKVAQKSDMTPSEYIRATVLMGMVLDGEPDAMKIVIKTLGMVAVATMKKKLRFTESELAEPR
jgi:hypothetical protein